MDTMRKEICLIGSLLLLSIPQTSWAKVDLGYFYNDSLQNKLMRNYSLQAEDESFPFEPEKYLSIESILAVRPGYQSEIENPFYCRESIRSFSSCSISMPLTNHLGYQKTGHLFLDDNKLTAYLKDISRSIDRSAENGKLKIGEDGKVAAFNESQEGRKLDTEKSVRQITDFFQKETDVSSIELAVEKIKPEVNTGNIDKYGIKERIAHGESNFRGSPANRIHNIKVALERFDGTLIKPGEEFSFTTILGEVDGEHGYKEELVIKDNETIPEFGGGVCQVSTTVFRAALNGGLDISERHNHAYPVQYYAPQGTDATIYVPKPDLKFINNTGSHILIQTKIEGTILSIDFYGSSDGRTIELVGPKVTERTPDGKMKTILTQIVKDASGKIIQEESFKSFYDNPDNYHRDQLLTEKPDDWSKKQWKDYKIQHGM